jgi:hypothetical protein
VLLGDPIKIQEGTSATPAFGEEQTGGGGRQRVPTHTRPGISRVEGSVTVEFAIDGL